MSHVRASHLQSHRTISARATYRVDTHRMCNHSELNTCKISHEVLVVACTATNLASMSGEACCLQLLHVYACVTTVSYTDIWH